MSQKPSRRLPRWLKIVLGIGVLAMVVACCGLAFVTFWPDVAAQNIDRLRDIIGDEPVAQLEAAVLSIQDCVQQLAYQLGLMQPAAPWEDTHPNPAANSPTPARADELTKVAVEPTGTEPTSTPPDTRTSAPTGTFTALLTNTPGRSPTSTLTPTYTAATCNIRISESVMYARSSVGLTAHVNADERDSATVYTWFVNSASISGSDGGLIYTFPAPGSYTVKLTTTMKSGQSPSCATTLDVKEPQMFASTYAATLDVKEPSTFTSTYTATLDVKEPSTFTSTYTATPPQPTSTPSGVSSLPAWQMVSLTPLGKLEGEGQWSPYLWAADKQTVVAYRTFLQADPERPYSITAIVAFDLQTTRLHFVLGTDEPRPTVPGPSRTGTIPDIDRQPGILLATFNGGFKARHGNYGAMVNDLVALPAIDGLATVGMYADGRVQIGEWNTDIKDSPDLVAWRQNGDMLIRDGQINPDTAQTTAVWGLTINGDTITWRSALGLSADRRTLYYVAGAQLDVATLAKVMAQAGAAEALQLDANNYYVHFAAVRSTGTNLAAEPLFKTMIHADRYLKSYSRDFFYVTATIRH